MLYPCHKIKSIPSTLNKSGFIPFPKSVQFGIWSLYKIKITAKLEVPTFNRCGIDNDKRFNHLLAKECAVGTDVCRPLYHPGVHENMLRTVGRVDKPPVWLPSETSFFITLSPVLPQIWHLFFGLGPCTFKTSLWKNECYH